MQKDDDTRAGATPRYPSHLDMRAPRVIGARDNGAGRKTSRLQRQFRRLQGRVFQPWVSMEWIHIRRNDVFADHERKTGEPLQAMTPVVHACADSQKVFAKDFVAAWTRVMNADRSEPH